MSNEERGDWPGTTGWRILQLERFQREIEPRVRLLEQGNQALQELKESVKDVRTAQDKSERDQLRNLFAALATIITVILTTLAHYVFK